MTRKIRVIENVTLSEIELANKASTYIQLGKARNIEFHPWHTTRDEAYEFENVPIQQVRINEQEFEYAVTSKVKKKLWFIFDQLNTLKSDKEVIRRELQSAKNIIKDYKLQERLIRDANFMRRMYYLLTGKLP